MVKYTENKTNVWAGLTILLGWRFKGQEILLGEYLSLNFLYIVFVN